MTQWYYARGGQQNGPVTLDELRSLARSGQLDAKDLVWNSSMADWLPAATVGGIMDGAPAAAANPYSTPGSALVPGSLEELQGPAVEIEPGSEPFEVMTCVARGFELTKRQFLVLFLAFLIFVAIYLAITIPFSAGQIMGQFNAMQAGTPPPTAVGSPADVFNQSVRSQLTPIYFVEQLVTLVCSSFLMAGLFRITLNVVSGARAEVGQLFSQGKNLVKILGITILLTLPSWIGMLAVAYLPYGWIGMVLTTIVYIGLLLRFGFAPLAVVDRDLGLVEALKYSAAITRNNQLKIFGLGVMMFLIYLGGLIACCVGIFFAIPMALLAGTAAYRWMQYGRRAVMDYPGTTRPLLATEANN